MSQARDASHSGDAAALRNPDGSWKYTNRLIHESSPYLLQHAHNPVDWFPWGDEAFEEARRTNRPIFLSIGYSTCYWCHVMERQCFQDPLIARLMNELYVNIKVDREERPDVDDIYMAALQAMTGRGGWPMSVFLTPPGAAGPDDPGLQPFYAGTYFPPTPMRGMPSFPEVLQHLATVWHNDREQVLEQARRVTTAVRDQLTRRSPDTEPSRDSVLLAFKQLMHIYDREHGGFGGAPKFPQPNQLDFLIAYYRHGREDESAWQPIAHTLDRMARGGMYDQIGGGFHRYSVDERWLVPHFEKMLYDNAQLVQTYCAAHEIRPRVEDFDFYPRVVRQVCDYVLREMLDETGTFWSAQDAEVDAREGGNYVWTTDQVREALQPLRDTVLTDLALTMYGLDRGPSFQDPHHPDEPPTNVLYLPVPLHELAQQRGMTFGELLRAKLAIDAALFAARSRRRQPATDDKVLMAWNGMMIAALARAGRTLSELRYVEAAEQAATYILQNMRDADGGLYRTMREGRAKIAGFLEDYAFFIHGLIELHHSQPTGKWLDEAVVLMRQASARFATKEGGYYDTLADQRDLLVRTRSFYDGAISSGNSQMAHNLLDLHELTGDDRYLDAAIATISAFADSMQRYGAGMAHMQHALLRALMRTPTHVTSAARTHNSDFLEPVTAQVTPAQIDFNATSQTIRVTLRIREGYHINANAPLQQFLTPTELLLRDGPGLELTVAYPQGRNRRFMFADEMLTVYEDTVELEANIRATGPIPRDVEPKLVVRYQACTEQACMAPREVELPLRMA